MKFLRTVSTRRLLAMIAGLIAAIAAGTTIAVAAAGTGPLPPPKRLAQALHDAATAPPVTGITARISFTNHLIDSSNIQGSDPILTGATGRLWLSSDRRLRLELQSSNGEDAQVVVNNGSFWAYDPSANTVYEGTLPAQAADGNAAGDRTAGGETLPSVAQIQADLNHLMRHAVLSGAIPSSAAGRKAYTVRVSPRHDGGLLGAAELAWDSVRGVPLRFAVYARGGGAPVLELKATDIAYGSVPASDFTAAPPSGAKVVKVSTPGTGSAASKGESRARGHTAHAEVTGAGAVARHLPFPLRAPGRLVGLPRQSVTLLDWGGSPAALVTYGQHLGGIAVIEQKAHSTTGQTQASGDHSGLNLPTVSINGVTGQELDTALGTMVHFTRGGVAYTVLGSVPAAAADAAARALVP